MTATPSTQAVPRATSATGILPGLSTDEAAILGYLNDVMEAQSRTLGTVLKKDQAKYSEKSLTARAAALCGRLRKTGFVARVTDLGAWRITKVGRAALEAFKAASAG